MRPRIEIVEVVSFQLLVTQEAVEQLLTELTTELPLSLEQEGEDLVLAQKETDCSLRFSGTGDDLELSEILICNDDGGAFFFRVVARLITDHRGDLEVRVQWNTPERNTHGTFAPVVFRRGRGVVPKTSAANALRNTLQVGAESQGELSPIPSSEGPAPDEDEIAQLLARAKASWAEYQKLKAKRADDER